MTSGQWFCRIQDYQTYCSQHVVFSELLFSGLKLVRIDILRIRRPQNYYSEVMGRLRTVILRVTQHLRTTVLTVSQPQNRFLMVGRSQNYYSEVMGCLRTVILRVTQHLRTPVLTVYQSQNRYFLGLGDLRTTILRLRGALELSFSGSHSI